MKSNKVRVGSFKRKINMYAIRNKEKFEAEVGELIIKIRRHIETSITHIDTHASYHDKKIVNNIINLKIHEFRMKEAKEWLDQMEINEWLENKKALQKEFQNARQLLLTG